jgi:hypothetical protein
LLTQNQFYRGTKLRLKWHPEFQGRVLLLPYDALCNVEDERSP